MLQSLTLCQLSSPPQYSVEIAEWGLFIPVLSRSHAAVPVHQLHCVHYYSHGIPIEKKWKTGISIPDVDLYTAVRDVPFDHSYLQTVNSAYFDNGVVWYWQLGVGGSRPFCCFLSFFPHLSFLFPFFSPPKISTQIQPRV